MLEIGYDLHKRNLLGSYFSLRLMGCETIMHKLVETVLIPLTSNNKYRETEEMYTELLTAFPQYHNKKYTASLEVGVEINLEGELFIRAYVFEKV